MMQGEMSEDDDLPAASEPGDDQSLTWLPFAGAAAVALLIASVIVFVGAGSDNYVGTKTDADGALTCPATYQQRRFGDHKKAWVPVEPTGVDGGPNLVPDSLPSHVTICRYGATAAAFDRPVKVELTGHRTLTGGLRAATKELSALPKARDGVGVCPPGGAVDNYLVGLTFATGLLWVSVPGGACLEPSNGDFTTSAGLSVRVAAAYEARVWP